MTETITSTVIYTFTLASGKTFAVDNAASVGQVINGGLLVAMLALFGLYFLYEVIYESHH